MKIAMYWFIILLTILFCVQSFGGQEAQEEEYEDAEHVTVIVNPPAPPVPQEKSDARFWSEIAGGVGTGVVAVGGIAWFVIRKKSESK
tara:strand:+ start:153 stop:416 length:264 start_codon:yes stop_codon:yes gene_type:complete